MTLLDATTTLIDAAKIYAPEEDAVIRRAIKRMEKRLAVLQFRHAKAVKNRRHCGWHICQVLIEAKCSRCGFKFDFGSFIKSAELTGRGQIKMLICPECDLQLIGLPAKGF